MTPDLSDILRKLENLIRTGHIAEVRGDRARVKLSPSLTTTWLKWYVFRAGDVVSWCSPSLGEQVTVLSPGGELVNGSILVGLYSENSPAPETSPLVAATHYPDGAVVRYDYEAHQLSATLPDGSSATVKADAVTADAAQTTCTGDVTIKGNLKVEGASEMQNGLAVQGGADGAAVVIDGDMKATGNFNTDGDVQAGDISLKKHRTAGVQPGGGESQGPIA